MHRKRMNKRSSKRNFRHGARVHGKNMRISPMRGGFRL